MLLKFILKVVKLATLVKEAKSKIIFVGLINIYGTPNTYKQYFDVKVLCLSLVN